MPHLHAVLAAESGTVHRLLGSRGRHGGYRYRADEPLPADIVVVQPVAPAWPARRPWVQDPNRPAPGWGGGGGFGMPVPAVPPAKPPA